MIKKLVVLMLVLSLVAFSMVGCGGTDKQVEEPKTEEPKAEEPKAEPVGINISTATTAGIYYALGNALSTLWNEEVDNVKISVQSTAGSGQNIELMMRGESELAFLQNGVAMDAYKGQGQYKDTPKQDFLGMAYLYPNLCYFVVRDGAGIETLEDLKGKRIAPGPVGSGTEINTREILLAGADIDYTNRKDAKPDYVSNSEAAEKFIDRQTDMAFIAGGIPHASVTEMFSRSDAKILPIEGEIRDKIIAQYPQYFAITVPAGSYKDQDKDIETIAVGNILAIHKDIPDQAVYDLLKTLYANLDTLSNTYAPAKNFKIGEALDGMTIPLHPGAVKFFEDNGVTVPDNLKL